MAKSTVLGYPRIGPHRELKVATEAYWNGQITKELLFKTAEDLRRYNWDIQSRIGLDMLPSNDFSFYDQMLDMAAMFGVVPQRYGWAGGRVDLETYFAMARGVQQSGLDVPAAEMTKWFDTNYHYIVPEFEVGQKFKLATLKPVDEYIEAKSKGYETRPVLVGPITFLMLGKCLNGGHALDHLDAFIEVYADLLLSLEEAGATWVQLDEPLLVTDIDARTQQAYATAYKKMRSSSKLKMLVTTPFGELEDNLNTAAALPIDALHVDLVRGEKQLEAVLAALPSNMILAAGVVDGRNIWLNNLSRSLSLLERCVDRLGSERVWVCSSCSLLHVPYDLDFERNLDSSTKSWMAFAKQKLDEIAILTLAINDGRLAIASEMTICQHAIAMRETSSFIHSRAVSERLTEQPLSSAGRASPYIQREKAQRDKLNLPLFPTTTIGSFPQTAEVRKMRTELRKNLISQETYDTFIKEQISACIAFQAEIDLDVLVHGEFERNDMVEFFGEKLKGFAFTQNGWVQSYGSRAVKPPIIYGDVYRAEPMTVVTAILAQSFTKRPVKGMLTGPVTILQWSFVRDDQPRSVTAHQIALALQDEVLDLEAAGISIIQVDEPAFREGLPLRKAERQRYYDWAVPAFRMVSTGVRDETQIHTHMCYSDFNDIIASIKDLDADVISIETSRSQMELLKAFADFKYPNEIGPGVYDIHSPRVPSEDEMVLLIQKACEHLEPSQIWINPDCGLKTRGWPETKLSLERMVSAAKALRSRYGYA